MNEGGGEKQNWKEGRGKKVFFILFYNCDLFESIIMWELDYHIFLYISL